MLVDVRPTTRLRGDKAVDLTASIQPVLEALYETRSTSPGCGSCATGSSTGPTSGTWSTCAILPANTNGSGPGSVRTGPADEQVEVAIDLRR